MSDAKGVAMCAKRFREQALNEGVRAGRIEKSSGQFVSPPSVQEAYLADNTTYQTWRLMSNMKEVLVEAASHILARKYGPLDRGACEALLTTFDLKESICSGDLRDLAAHAATASDFQAEEVFSRIFSLLRFAATQYWEEKKKTLLSASRLRTYLSRREVAKDLKEQLWDTDARVRLDNPWKPEGVTFLDSLPQLRGVAKSGKRSETEAWRSPIRLSTVTRSKTTQVGRPCNGRIAR